MDFRFVILYLALWIFATTTAAAVPETSENNDAGIDADNDADIDVAESNILNSLAALQPSSPSTNTDNLGDLTSYPYEGIRQNLYDTFAAPQPTFGVSINTRALLAPQVEVLRLTEDFFALTGDIIRRISSLVNDNYDLIKAVFNLLISKASNLQTFSLKGISVLRKILEFALHLFSDFSITLPSITLGSTQSAYAPHAIYGIPSSNTTNFN